MNLIHIPSCLNELSVFFSCSLEGSIIGDVVVDLEESSLIALVFPSRRVTVVDTSLQPVSIGGDIFCCWKEMRRWFYDIYNTLTLLKLHFFDILIKHSYLVNDGAALFWIGGFRWIFSLTSLSIYFRWNWVAHKLRSWRRSNTANWSKRRKMGNSWVTSRNSTRF